ncbi:MAG: TonB-dependent receptor [candidate division Zixibacteria bacterium]|nr:TonB-dependent receptor [candidate division Zixibacteria bacterium]
MKLLRLCGLVAFSLAFICLHLVYAGTTGKISGVVLDSEDKQPVPGAKVRVEGSTMGAMVNVVDGSFVIQNVPPGTYTLIAECIGYNDFTVTELTVHIDVTTEQDFTLVSEAIKVDDIIVEAEVKEIDKFETNTVSRISTKEIEALPVTDIQGIIKTQTGFVSQGGALHVRGSRAGELAFVDDGVLIRDQLGGYGESNIGGNESTPLSRSGLNLSSSDIADVSIMKGNYSAEYGDMAGGLVTTSRKEGSNRITKFNVEFLTDDFGFPALNKYSFNQDKFYTSVSGPVPLLSDQLFPALGLKWPGERMAYYGSFSVDKSDSYVDYNNYDSPNSKIDYGTEEFLGITIPNRRINKYAGTAKITWKLDKNSRYKLNLRYTNEWGSGRNFQYNYIYTPETATVIKTSKEITSARLSFNPPFLKDTFGEIQFSEVIQTYERLPGGLNPSNFYVPIEGFEGYLDANGNGQWDEAETFQDLNGDGIWGEPYTDSNFNGRYDDGENYTDLNNNGYWDPEPFEDRNGDGRWDNDEYIYNDAYYVDVNGNGIYDDIDSVYIDQEGNGNGTFDPQLSDIYNEDHGEPWIDGDESLGEPYEDNNGNGVYDPNSDDVWLPINDLDHDGQYTGPDDPWSEGLPYRDLNQNGRYDRPNGRYDYGEWFDDQNGNGRLDYSDAFYDFGFDRWAQYHYDFTRTRTLGFNLTSQVSRHHDVKAGFEFKFHTIKYQDLQYPYFGYDGPPDNGAWSDLTRVIGVHDTTGNGIADRYITETYSKGIFRDFYTRTPKDGAFYFRDKIEYGELIANIGFRYEFFIQAREAKDSVSLEAEGLGYRKIIDSQQKLAPRIGFSFPISEKAKLMFNYGHFYQRPGFVKYYQRRTQASAAAAVFGNPNLDYEKTILYEIGVQYAIAEGYLVDISGFYKDQYGLLNTVPEGITPNSPDFQDNVDYARSRGLEFELEKKYGQFIAGSLKYEYTWAFGKSSSSRSDYYIRFAGGEISIKENPLDWDIRHQLTLSGVLNVNKGEHPHFGIIKLPDDWSMSALWLYKSGRPFTPDRGYPGLSFGANENPQTNSKRMPATSSVDIGIDKKFQAYGMNYTISLLIANVFDFKNVDDIYETTGMANTNVNLNRQIVTGQPIDMDPVMYTPGRQITFGLKVNF